MEVGVVVILGLAVYRVTALVTTDKVTLGFRRRILRRFPPRIVPLVDDAGADLPGTGTVEPRWPVVLTSCDWCLGAWLAGFAVLAAHAAGLLDSWSYTGFAWPAVAAVAGILCEIVTRLTRS